MNVTSIVSGKIVATPSGTEWAQAYAAGNFFAVLSLHTTNDDHLNVLGKGVFNNLQAEFFALEEKSLTTIREAIEKSVESLPESVTLSLAAGYVKEQALYLFVHTSGSIIIKREQKLGTLLEKRAEDDSPIVAASGVAKPGDIIVLETASFVKDMSKDLQQVLTENTSVDDATEALSPLIHKQEGGQAAILLGFTGTSTQVAIAEEADDDTVITPFHDGKGIDEEKSENKEELPEKPVENTNVLDTQPEEGKMTGPENEYTSPLPEESSEETDAEDTSSIAEPERKKRAFLTSLSHKRKLFLSIAVIILLVLITSIFFTLSTNQNAKTKEAFDTVYTQAQREYDEGMGLVSLNQPLAQDDFKNAQKLIKDNVEKFPAGSEERKQLEQLLAKVEKELQGTSVSQQITAEETAAADSPLLAALNGNNDAVAGAEDTENIYLLTEDAILKQEKGEDESETLVENDEDWENAVGISTFGSNVYVLDRENGVIKFVPTSSDYAKTSYFVGDAPDMKNAAAMTIDTSIYILMSDGDILKFTRGRAVDFSVSGLTTPFSTPKKIFTNEDTDSIYVLDSTNSRVVQLSKAGAFEEEYKSDVIKNAQDFTVSEGDGLIYVLSNKKLYSLPLK